MADEQVTETTAVAGADESAKTFTQEQLDKVIAERLTRERAKFADHDELRKKAETLEAELKKRKEAEMTEVEKLQATKAELENQLTAYAAYKERWDEHEIAQKAKVAARMADLDENQKAIVETIPDVDKQLAAIEAFTATTRKPDVSGGSAAARMKGVLSVDEITKMRIGGDSRWREEYAKAKKAGTVL